MGPEEPAGPQQDVVTGSGLALRPSGIQRDTMPTSMFFRVLV